MYRRGMIAVVALALSLAAAPAFAQAATQQVNSGLGIGALGGLTWTSINSENTVQGVDLNAGSGWMLGIWFGGNRDGRAGLMGELSYVVKKIKFSDSDEEIGQTLSYVELPVLLRINTGSRHRDKPSLYFLVGPVFDIQVKSERDGNTDVSEDYQGLDIGIMGGVGFEVVRIGIEARYSWGLKSVLATDAALDSGFGSTKQNTLQIIGKIRFN